VSRTYALLRATFIILIYLIFKVNRYDIKKMKSFRLHLELSKLFIFTSDKALHFGTEILLYTIL